MITFFDEVQLLSVSATFHNVSNINNDALADEVLSSQKRLSSNKNSPLYEDTLFSPVEGSEGHKLIGMIERYFNSEGLTISEIWSQIHYPKESTNTHNHVPFKYGFVYYVKVPEGAGDLSFYFREPDITTSISPVQGRLIVFPAWCNHYVSKNTGDDIRISIAGNISPL